MTKRLKSYGGIAYFPSHPFCDMHGLVRVCLQAENIRKACRELARFGMTVKPGDFSRGYWSETKSAVEGALCAGARGPWVAELAKAYLGPDGYRELAAKRAKAGG